MKGRHVQRLIPTDIIINCQKEDGDERAPSCRPADDPCHQCEPIRRHDGCTRHSLPRHVVIGARNTSIQFPPPSNRHNLPAHLRTPQLLVLDPPSLLPHTFTELFVASWPQHGYPNIRALPLIASYGLIVLKNRKLLSPFESTAVLEHFVKADRKNIVS